LIPANTATGNLVILSLAFDITAVTVASPPNTSKFLFRGLGDNAVTPHKVHLRKTNLRCPLCSKALNQEEYDEAATRLKLLEYRRTAQRRQTQEVKKLGLTQRELEIVATLIAGYSNKDIAKHFHISEFTVKRHLSNIFDKIGVSTRLELALFALSGLAGTSGLGRK
jgi:DNA-binding CsgD family transcriptional regulator